ncbi:hypothetical protein E1202_20445 [Saccharopolyspora karakumensis]|uniref:Uncharacterized protein n=1 Tax=Saccharopolyspora karakumensis TaxID=2530386 RepID=A0A4R5BGB0_9PSEU|nr:DUF6346 domain-containing protein [Saccharopolyspora karakumensis]TDD85658.1 hypothetical protein E1202_20445 [Saccharopolyspora karakumensis]
MSAGIERAGYVAWQVVVRLVALALCYTVFAVSGALSSDGVVTQRGTALATRCERVGPVSSSGLGWYWRCDAAITWDDGSTGETVFKQSELTPRNHAEPAPVAWREVDNSGHMITAERPKPFAGFGWAMMIPLLGVAIMGVEIPGPRSPFAEQWAGRRRTTRLQLWQPLALPVGWGLLIAGGLATAAPAVVPGLAVITLLLGHFALAAAVVMGINRRRHGLEPPPLISPERQVTCERAGNRLRWIGSAGTLLGLVAGFGNWLGVLGAVAIPLAVLAFGQRLLLIADRHRGQFDGTAKDGATS